MPLSPPTECVYLTSQAWTRKLTFENLIDFLMLIAIVKAKNIWNIRTDRTGSIVILVIVHENPITFSRVNRALIAAVCTRKSYASISSVDRQSKCDFGKTVCRYLDFSWFVFFTITFTIEMRTSRRQTWGRKTIEMANNWVSIRVDKMLLTRALSACTAPISHQPIR